MAFKIYKKKNLVLKEEENNRTAYVKPTSQGASNSSLASDIQSSVTKNPSTKNFVVNGDYYDGNSSDNALTLDVDAKNSTDAANKIKAMNNSPEVKRLGTDAMYNVHLEQVERKLKEGIRFKKKELNKLFNN